jgi:hypothetical protein
LEAPRRGSGPTEQGKKDPDELQASAAEVFEAFQAGVSRVVVPEDVDVHFDLGVAYREMGLYRDALEAFAVVLTSPRAEASRKGNAAALALTLLDLGEDPTAALRRWLFPE